MCSRVFLFSSQCLLQTLSLVLSASPQMWYPFIYGWVVPKIMNILLYSMYSSILCISPRIYSAALWEVSELDCLIVICQITELWKSSLGKIVSAFNASGFLPGLCYAYFCNTYKFGVFTAYPPFLIQTCNFTFS